jgi:hypothetical protein
VELLLERAQELSRETRAINGEAWLVMRGVEEDSSLVHRSALSERDGLVIQLVIVEGLQEEIEIFETILSNMSLSP